jgi:hypothetical protein
MKITGEPPEGARPGEPPASAGFTLDSIRPVRDFTARKTLEQAHAFVEGIARTFRDADTDEDAARLVRDLADVGITAADAEQLAAQAVALVEVMGDRDRKADIFQMAVREAGQGERAMYERLVAFARVLRLQLGATSPALARFGVPPEVSDEARARAKQPPPSRPIYSAATFKQP